MSISDRTDARYLPLIRYADVEGSARWLCNALGFRVHMAVRDPDGVMDYVHLVQGAVNVVIKPLDGADRADGGGDPQSRYVFVDNVGAHFETARAEGAQIVIGPQRTPGMGLGYTCRDAEGLIWSFGSFDPWKLAHLPESSQGWESDFTDPGVEQSQEVPAPHAAGVEPHATMPEPHLLASRRPTSSRGVVAALAIGGIVGSVLAAAGLYYVNPKAEAVAQQIAVEQVQRMRSEAAMQQAQSALTQERIAKEHFQGVAQKLEATLASERAAAADAEAQSRQAHEQLAAQLDGLSEAKTAVDGKLSEAEKQWRAVQDTLAGELEQAKAAAQRAQTERAELEATMTARVFSIEGTLRQAQDAQKTALSAKAEAEQQLSDERKKRQKAESALQTAMANLKAERDARVEAEQRADKLAAKLITRRPAANVARAKPAARAKAVAARKKPVAVKMKTVTYTVDDIGFQP